MKVFSKILPLVTNRWSNPGSQIIAGKHVIPLGKSYFKPLAANLSPNSLLAFVDSGSGDVFRSPSAQLVFMRVYGSVFENNVRKSSVLKECFLLVTLIKKNKLVFEARILDREGAELDLFTFDAFDCNLAQPKKRAETSAVVGVLRKLLEFKLCSELCDGLNSGNAVVRDGDLEVSHPVLQKVITELSTKAIEKKLHVLGLSKTSALCTDSGVSAVAALHNLSPSGSWVYDAGPVRFVKLHPKSRYIFRCDTLTRNPPFDALAANSVDPVFLGYPFGLLDADKFAQVTRSESGELQLRFALLTREKLGVLERSIDAHDILDLL